MTGMRKVFLLVGLIAGFGISAHAQQATHFANQSTRGLFQVQGPGEAEHALRVAEVLPA